MVMRLNTSGMKEDDPIVLDEVLEDVAFGAREAERPTTEQIAVEAIVAAQKTAGDPIDPNGARRLIRVLVALGLLRFP